MYDDKPLSEYLASMFEEVEPMDFYRELFPAGSFERWEHQDDKKPNGILTSISLTKTFKRKLPNGSEREEPCRHNCIIPDDLMIIEDEIQSANDFVIISPISYFGKNRTAKNAGYLYAVVIDLDYIIRDADEDPRGLRNLFHQIEHGLHAEPTYIVSSGRGLHLYWLLNEPIHLTEQNVKELKKMRNEMIRRLWNDAITDKYKTPEYESVYQGFRAVGSITKRGTRCRAFLYGDCVKRYDIEDLNKYLPYKETHAHINKQYERPKGKLTYEQAKERYPEWAELHPKGVYQKKKQRYFMKRQVYDKYFERIKGEITVGHRYWAIHNLCAMARKCGIEYEEVEADALSLLKDYDALGEGKEPFTLDDVMSALAYYEDPDAWSITREKTEEETGLKFPISKRNELDQELHLELARERKAGLKRAGRIKDGRPPKYKEAVEQYFREHPNASVTDCSCDLDISRPTVYKWKP